MNFLKKHFFLLLFTFSFFVALILYQSVLGFYFFQDDFFEMNAAKAKNLTDYLNFFKFRSDIVDWRPISQLNYFFFFQKIFGLNPVGYRLISFTLFFATAFLIAKTFAKITKNQSVGLLSSAFWLTSSVHFINHTWISASYNIIGTFFFMLTSLLFVLSLEKHSKILYIASFGTFLLTLGSFEFAITWPALFGIYYLIIGNNSPILTFKKLLPYVAVSLAYLIARLTIMEVPKIPEYIVTFNVESLKAFFWYLLWTFNIPEEFKKQITNNLLVFNQKFFDEYRTLILQTFAAFAVVAIAGILTPTIRYLKAKISLDKKLLLLTVFWFALTISPVLIIPNHTFIMYLSLSSIGIYALISYLLISLNNKLLIVFVFVIWLSSSVITLNFYKNNYWMIHAQEFSAKFARDIKSQFPTLPQNSVLLYSLNDKREIQSLQENEALRLLLNDQTLLIYYNKMALRQDLENLKNRPIYIYLESE